MKAVIKVILSADKNPFLGTKIFFPREEKMKVGRGRDFMLIK